MERNYFNLFLGAACTHIVQVVVARAPPRKLTVSIVRRRPHSSAGLQVRDRLRLIQFACPFCSR